MLRWVSLVTPSWRREAWLREWLAEVDASAPQRLAPMLAGALAHAWWLRRREWSLNMLGPDVRYALRALTARRGFTAAVILTLGLGIGAATAMFSVVDAVMLRPLPYPDASRIVAIWPRVSVSPHLAGDLGRPRDGFEVIGAYSGWGFTLTGGDTAEAVDGARLTAEVWTTLGVAAALGRTFESDASRPGLDRVAVIGDGLWRRRFGAAADVVGRRLTINGQDDVVVGVMPASFGFPTQRSELWTPLTIDPAADDYDSNFARVIGRLAAGITPEIARDRLRPTVDALHRERPRQFTDRFVQAAVVEPLQNVLVRDIRTPLSLLLAAVGLLLVIACANTAQLLLARAGARDLEISVRASLGATRARIVRQLLLESLALAVAGGALGLVLATWLVALFVPLVPDLPDVGRASIVDPRVAAFVVALVAGTAMLFGLAPAVHASRSAAAATLKSGRGGMRSPSRTRAGQVLVFVEVTLATTLVIGAALLGRSFAHLMRVDLGVQPDHVLTARISAPDFRYRTDDQLRELFATVLSQVSRIGGIDVVGGIHLLPLTPDNWNPGVNVAGVPDHAQYQGDVNWRVVFPDYFRSMGIPVRAGRAFGAADSAGVAPVALVNDTFAREVLRGAPAIGQRVHTFFEGEGVFATIVGVVGDVHQHAIDQPPKPEMYRPFAQHPLSSMRLMIRTAGDPTTAAATLRAVVSGLDADVVVDRVMPFTGVIDQALGSTRVPLLLAVMLSVVAFGLGVTGIAAVLTHDVADRRTEIALRLALGATPASVRRGVLARGLAVGALGVLAGAAGAVVMGGALGAVLPGVDAADPFTIGGVGLGFLVVIALACDLPARRAARVDPLGALRTS